MPEETEPPGDAKDKSEHGHGLGDRLHDAEHRVEEALRDTVARVENRMILAGEAETSASPEVNLASALEVAINPPQEPDEATEGDAAADQCIRGKARPSDRSKRVQRPRSAGPSRVIATPWRPMRPVRPTRWVNSSGVSGSS